MTGKCCPCGETIYERWEREDQEAKAAALASPNTWIQVSDVVEDFGDIGGDVQAGPAWAKRFIRWIPRIDKWAVVNDAYYASRDDVTGEVTEPVCVERQLELMICRDPSDPGGTEVYADYEYEYAEDPTRDDYDAYARELAADSRPEDYPDPLNHRDAARFS